MDNKNYKLFIAISSRALFDLEEENDIFEKRGVQEYREHQVNQQDKKLKKGGAFYFIESLLKLNKILKQDIIEVMIISKNSSEMGIRIFNSIEEYQLPIIRAAFLSGESVVKYLKAFECDLFLSKNATDVKEAINQGFAAARIYNSEGSEPYEKNFTSEARSDSQGNEIRIAFDGDAVIFSKEAEEIYRKKNLNAFLEHEKKNALSPLPEGPFAKFLKTLVLIQKEHSAGKSKFKIKTALVTARSSPAHERVIRTLMTWGVIMDNAFFLGGFSKDKVLKEFNPHIYFDDQKEHLNPASKGSPSGEVFPKK